MKPFDFNNVIANKKIPWQNLTEEDKKSFNLFIVNRHISMSQNNIDIINFCQKYYNIPLKDIYKIYLSLLEYDKYIKYIKKTSKYNKELLNSISESYEISNNEAEEYLNILSNKEIEEFLISKGYTKKEILKMIK